MHLAGRSVHLYMTTPRVLGWGLYSGNSIGEGFFKKKGKKRGRVEIKIVLITLASGIFTLKVRLYWIDSISSLNLTAISRESSKLI